jgi:hypothetical protein
MDTTPIDDHHHLCGGGAAGGHPVMEILAHRVGITIRHEWRADWGRAILDRAADAEPHAARDLAPGVMAPPDPAFAAFVACALTLA